MPEGGGDCHLCHIHDHAPASTLLRTHPLRASQSRSRNPSKSSTTTLHRNVHHHHNHHPDGGHHSRENGTIRDSDAKQARVASALAKLSEKSHSLPGSRSSTMSRQNEVSILPNGSPPGHRGGDAHSLTRSQRSQQEYNNVLAALLDTRVGSLPSSHSPSHREPDLLNALPRTHNNSRASTLSRVQLHHGPGSNLTLAQDTEQDYYTHINRGRYKDEARKQRFNIQTVMLIGCYTMLFVVAIIVGVVLCQQNGWLGFGHGSSDEISGNLNDSPSKKGSSPSSMRDLERITRGRGGTRGNRPGPTIDYDYPTDGQPPRINTAGVFPGRPGRGSTRQNNPDSERDPLRTVNFQPTNPADGNRKLPPGGLRPGQRTPSPVGGGNSRNRFGQADGAGVRGDGVDNDNSLGSGKSITDSRDTSPNNGLNGNGGNIRNSNANGGNIRNPNANGGNIRNPNVNGGQSRNTNPFNNSDRTGRPGLQNFPDNSQTGFNQNVGGINNNRPNNPNTNTNIGSNINSNPVNNRNFNGAGSNINGGGSSSIQGGSQVNDGGIRNRPTIDFGLSKGTPGNFDSGLDNSRNQNGNFNTGSDFTENGTPGSFPSGSGNMPANSNVGSGSNGRGNFNGRGNTNGGSGSDGRGNINGAADSNGGNFNGGSGSNGRGNINGASGSNGGNFNGGSGSNGRGNINGAAGSNGGNFNGGSGFNGRGNINGAAGSNGGNFNGGSGSNGRGNINGATGSNGGNFNGGSGSNGRGNINGAAGSNGGNFNGGSGSNRRGNINGAAGSNGGNFNAGSGFGGGNFNTGSRGVGNFDNGASSSGVGNSNMDSRGTGNFDNTDGSLGVGNFNSGSSTGETNFDNASGSRGAGNLDTGSGSGGTTTFNNGGGFSEVENLDIGPGTTGTRRTANSNNFGGSSSTGNSNTGSDTRGTTNFDNASGSSGQGNFNTGNSNTGSGTRGTTNFDNASGSSGQGNFNTGSGTRGTTNFDNADGSGGLGNFDMGSGSRGNTNFDNNGGSSGFGVSGGFGNSDGSMSRLPGDGNSASGTRGVTNFDHAGGSIGPGNSNIGSGLRGTTDFDNADGFGGVGSFDTGSGTRPSSNFGSDGGSAGLGTFNTGSDTRGPMNVGSGSGSDGVGGFDTGSGTRGSTNFNSGGSQNGGGNFSPGVTMTGSSNLNSESGGGSFDTSSVSGGANNFNMGAGMRGQGSSDIDSGSGGSPGNFGGGSGTRNFNSGSAGTRNFNGGSGNSGNQPVDSNVSGIGINGNIPGSNLGSILTDRGNTQNRNFPTGSRNSESSNTGTMGMGNGHANGGLGSNLDIPTGTFGAGRPPTAISGMLPQGMRDLGNGDRRRMPGGRNLNMQSVGQNSPTDSMRVKQTGGGNADPNMHPLNTGVNAPQPSNGHNWEKHMPKGGSNTNRNSGSHVGGMTPVAISTANSGAGNSQILSGGVGLPSLASDAKSIGSRQPANRFGTAPGVALAIDDPDYSNAPTPVIPNTTQRGIITIPPLDNQVTPLKVMRGFSVQRGEVVAISTIKSSDKDISILQPDHDVIFHITPNAPGAGVSLIRHPSQDPGQMDMMGSASTTRAPTRGVPSPVLRRWEHTDGDGTLSRGLVRKDGSFAFTNCRPSEICGQPTGSRGG